MLEIVSNTIGFLLATTTLFTLELLPMDNSIGILENKNEFLPIFHIMLAVADCHQ